MEYQGLQEPVLRHCYLPSYTISDKPLVLHLAGLNQNYCSYTDFIFSVPEP